MKRNNQNGQSMVLAVVFLTVLMGMSALVLDVGSWYRSHRAAQSAADASALAAAQLLPGPTGPASTLATAYANKNGGGLAGSDITYSTKWVANDTVATKVVRPTPGVFARLFGVGNVKVTGRASARAFNLTAARHVAPIVVHYKHSKLHCTGGSQHPTCNPEFGVSTTLNLEDLHQPGGGNGAGAFGLINLNQLDDTGNIGAGTLADWLQNGFNDDMPLGQYNSAPSANFNNSQFRAALDSVLNKEVLFPVYRLLTGPGANARYDIIGWVGFYIRSYSANGSSGSLTGEFSRYIAEGIPAEGGGGGGADFGAHEVELVN
jgi:hypothetical protein